MFGCRYGGRSRRGELALTRFTRHRSTWRRVNSSQKKQLGDGQRDDTWLRTETGGEKEMMSGKELVCFSLTRPYKFTRVKIMKKGQTYGHTDPFYSFHNLKWCQVLSNVVEILHKNIFYIN